jgi:hypothetical protein
MAGGWLTLQIGALQRAGTLLFENLLVFSNIDEGPIELAHPDLIYANRQN